MITAEKIWSSTSLPTLPAVAVRLLQYSRDPDSDVDDYVRTIKSDPAITAKVLKAANSSFFGFRSKITSLEKAVPLLGTNTVSTLSLSFSLANNAFGTGAAAGHYHAYWLQSVVQAIVAELLARQVQRGMEPEFFLAGLMLDFGRLAMLRTIPTEYQAVLDSYQPHERSLDVAEREALGYDHVLIGTELLKKWELPESVVGAVRTHHTEWNETTEAGLDQWSSVARGAAFAAAAGEYFCTTGRGRALQRMRQLASVFYGFDDTRLESFLAEARERIDACAELFSANASSICEPEVLLAEANEQLANMALMAQISTSQNIERQMQIELEIRQLEFRNQELEAQAISDGLTGVLNRCFFEETLKKEVSRCQRHSLSAGLLFCDVDSFKKINDQRGHAAGDEVLRHVARAIAGAIRTSDTLARYGGEEFVILLIETDEAGIALVAERIRAAVEQLQIDWHGERIPVTISIGGCICRPLSRADQQVTAQLVIQADEAMYSAKRNGRNRVEIRDYQAAVAT